MIMLLRLFLNALFFKENYLSCNKKLLSYYYWDRLIHYGRWIFLI